MEWGLKNTICMEVMSTMNKISDVLTVISFMLFIVLKIFEKNITSMASLLCGAIFIWKGCDFAGKRI